MSTGVACDDVENEDSTSDDVQYRAVRKRVESLKPSPENERIYRHVHDDPDTIDLAKSIEKHGLREPLIITADNYVVSGHRRLGALRWLGQAFARCYVLAVRRDSMSSDEYLALLRDHNRQRRKSVAEQVREELIDINPDDAHKSLVMNRVQSVYAATLSDNVQLLEIESAKKRPKLSESKGDHTKFVKEIVFGSRKPYWPLSVRGVHYPLLNYDFVRGYYRKRELRYRNDNCSYKATSDLITRLRVNREIPWEAFDDPTRPCWTWACSSESCKPSVRNPRIWKPHERRPRKP